MKDDSTNDEESKEDANRNLTDLREEAIMLAMTGLNGKEIAKAMGKEGWAAMKTVQRATYCFDPVKKSRLMAFCIAVDIGYRQYLFDKFKDKHAVHIERYEKAKAEAAKRFKKGGDGVTRE